MIPLRLRLRFNSDPVREPVAFFLPGDEPEAWLHEIAGWGVPMDRLRLYAVPWSVRNRRPCGVLVTLPHGKDSRATPDQGDKLSSPPKPGPLAQPYGRFGPRLFLPAQARPDPPVTEPELEAKLVGDVLVFHPAAGLVGFSFEEGLGIEDLLDAPPFCDVAWDLAQPGTAAPPRLLSVEPEQPPTVALILGEGRGDIGCLPPTKLPRASGEARSGPVRKMGLWVGQQAARAAQRLASQARLLDAEATWLKRAQDWSARKAADVASRLEALRRRELDRLLRLLETDPDQGLRFALPLQGAGGRGLAAPTASLPPRHPLFNLSKLFGSGLPADPWEVPPDTYRQLQRKYREAANRELRLGRFRRAAYIFAELLGDFPSAASALDQGRHYREAAVLYRDSLKQPVAAAQCLERGGLLAEAIPLYEAHGMHEKAADLYIRLERAEEAEKAYRFAVKQLQDAGDTLAASRLLEEKLRRSDEALALLASAWPSSDQAALCLRARFHLLGRLGRHRDAAHLVSHLREEKLPPSRIQDLAAALAEIASSYSDRRVRAGAADAARVVAGRRLSEDVGPQETGELVRAVACLAPEDRLLRRDGQRFTERRKKQLAERSKRIEAVAGQSRDHLRGDVEAVRRFTLPEDVCWLAAAPMHLGFCAAGFTSGRIALIRGLWNGSHQRLDLTCQARGVERILLSPSSPWVNPPVGLLARPEGGPPVGISQFPASNALGFPHPLSAGTPPWMPAGILAFTHGHHQDVWVVREQGQRQVLSVHHENGDVIATHDLPPLPEGIDEEGGEEQAPSPRILLLQRRGQLFIARGRQLFVFHGSITETVEFPHPILELAGSLAHLLPCIAVACRDGGLVLWGGMHWGKKRAFGLDMDRPRVAFTLGGHLIAADAREGRIYKTSQLTLSQPSLFQTREDILTVVPAEGTDSFALFTRGGYVALYRIRHSA